MRHSARTEAPGVAPGASAFPEAVTRWRLDGGADWAAALGTGRPILIVDHATTPELAQAVTRLAEDRDCVVVACDPVVDTVKAIEQGVVTGTVDRDLLAVVRPPVVVPAAVAEAGVPMPTAERLGDWVRSLRAAWPVLLVPGRPD